MNCARKICEFYELDFDDCIISYTRNGLAVDTTVITIECLDAESIFIDITEDPSTKSVTGKISRESSKTELDLLYFLIEHRLI